MHSYFNIVSVHELHFYISLELLIVHNTDSLTMLAAVCVLSLRTTFHFGRYCNINGYPKSSSKYKHIVQSPTHTVVLPGVGFLVTRRLAL